MQQKNDYKVSLNVKTNWLLVALSGICLAVCLFYLVINLLKFSSLQRNNGDLILICIVLLLITSLIFNILLWQLIGKESIIISDKLIIQKTGKLFNSNKKIEIFELESINFDDDKETPKWVKFLGIGGGKVKFNYLDRQTRYGQCISLEIAEQIVSAVEMEITSRTFV